MAGRSHECLDEEEAEIQNNGASPTDGQANCDAIEPCQAVLRLLLMAPALTLGMLWTTSNESKANHQRRPS